MGADDQNEGHEAGACVEHLWVLVGADLREDGSLLEHECSRCGATSAETPNDLAG